MDGSLPRGLGGQARYEASPYDTLFAHFVATVLPCSAGSRKPSQPVRCFAWARRGEARRERGANRQTGHHDVLVSRWCKHCRFELMP